MSNRKVNRCCADGCNNSESDNFRMMPFPKDPFLREQWTIMLDKEGWRPTDSSYLCDAHFEEKMWDIETNNLVLKENAVPTIFSFDFTEDVMTSRSEVDNGMELDDGCVDGDDDIVPVFQRKLPNILRRSSSKSHRPPKRSRKNGAQVPSNSLPQISSICSLNSAQTVKSKSKKVNNNQVQQAVVASPQQQYFIIASKPVTSTSAGSSSSLNTQQLPYIIQQPVANSPAGVGAPMLLASPLVIGGSEKGLKTATPNVAPTFAVIATTNTAVGKDGKVVKSGADNSTSQPIMLGTLTPVPPLVALVNHAPETQKGKTNTTGNAAVPVPPLVAFVNSGPVNSAATTSKASGTTAMPMPPLIALVSPLPVTSNTTAGKTVVVNSPNIVKNPPTSVNVTQSANLISSSTPGNVGTKWSIAMPSQFLHTVQPPSLRPLMVNNSNKANPLPNQKGNKSVRFSSNEPAVISLSDEEENPKKSVRNNNTCTNPWTSLIPAISVGSQRTLVSQTSNVITLCCSNTPHVRLTLFMIDYSGSQQCIQEAYIIPVKHQAEYSDEKTRKDKFLEAIKDAQKIFVRKGTVTQRVESSPEYIDLTCEEEDEDVFPVIDIEAHKEDEFYVDVWDGTRQTELVKNLLSSSTVKSKKGPKKSAPNPEKSKNENSPDVVDIFDDDDDDFEDLPPIDMAPDIYDSEANQSSEKVLRVNYGTLKRNIKVNMSFIPTLRMPGICPYCNRATRCIVHRSCYNLKAQISFKTTICNLCGQTFDSYCDLKKHVEFHLGANCFMCDKCPKSYSDEHSLEKHIKLNHEEHSENEWLCKKCNNFFLPVDSFQHDCAESLKSERADCNDNNKRSKSSRKKQHGMSLYCTKFCPFSMHKKCHINHNERSLNFSDCRICGMNGMRLITARYHTYQHMKIKPFRCKRCNNNFTTSKLLRAHKLKYHVRDTQAVSSLCEECGKVFRSQHRLKWHLDWKHGGPFSCEACGKAMHNRLALKNHLRMNRRSVNDSVSDLNNFYPGCVERSDVIQYVANGKIACMVCNRFFFNIRRHMLTHTAGKCIMCKRRFVNRFNLLKHLKNVHHVN